MARHAVLLVLLALVAAGCATHARSAASDAPSASVAPSTLAGHWQGDVNETASVLVIRTWPLDVTIAEDGSWQGTIGKAKASGTVRTRGDRVVMDGVAVTPDGTQPVYFDLRGDDRRRWGETVTSFGRASVALTRTG